MIAGALANSLSGMGFGLVCAPLLALVMDPRQAAALTILMSSPSGALVLFHDRRSVHLKEAALILVPGVLTAPLWAIAIADLNQTSLARAAGVTVLLSVALVAVGFRSQRMTGTGGAVVAGAASSGMTLLAAVGGPPVALYAMNAGWSASRVRATLQTVFLPLNGVALIALGLPQWHSSVYLPALVGLATGLLVGARVVRYVGPRLARNLTLLLAAASATTLLFAA
nr:sulfite exporter TauE/SafE family protein [Pedococcus sp. 5OH_020]